MENDNFISKSKIFKRKEFDPIHVRSTISKAKQKSKYLNLEFNVSLPVHIPIAKRIMINIIFINILSITSFCVSFNSYFYTSSTESIYLIIPLLPLTVYKIHINRNQCIHLENSDRY